MWHLAWFNVLFISVVYALCSHRWKLFSKLTAISWVRCAFLFECVFLAINGEEKTFFGILSAC